MGGVQAGIQATLLFSQWSNLLFCCTIPCFVEPYRQSKVSYHSMQETVQTNFWLHCKNDSLVINMFPKDCQKVVACQIKHDTLFLNKHSIWKIRLQIPVFDSMLNNTRLPTTEKATICGLIIYLCLSGAAFLEHIICIMVIIDGTDKCSRSQRFDQLSIHVIFFWPIK